jgi:hypothetical protein
VPKPEQKTNQKPRRREKNQREEGGAREAGRQGVWEGEERRREEDEDFDTPYT